MKKRQAFQLLSALLAAVVSCLVWLKISGSIPATWLMVTSPLIAVGLFVAVRDSLIVIVSAWILCRILIQRGDDEARKPVLCRKTQIKGRKNA